MGLVGWLKEARELLLGGSVSMASDKQAELLLPPGNYLRLNSERGTQVDFDDYERCRGLREVGEQVARTHRGRSSRAAPPCVVEPQLVRPIKRWR